MGHTMHLNRDIQEAIVRVLKYGEREPWMALREQNARQTLGGIYERFVLTAEELQYTLAPMGYLEEFYRFFAEEALVTKLQGEEHRLIDEYLKRRGWQETPRARRYLQALRDARIGLYEVTACDVGAWVELRDAIRGGEVRRVSAPDGGDELTLKCHLGGRVLEYEGELVLSNGVLYFGAGEGERLERILDDARVAKDGDLDGLANDSGIDRRTLASLADPDSTALATALLQFWLTGVLEDVRARESDTMEDLENEELEADSMLYCLGSLRFEPEHEAAIVDRLNALPGWERQTTGLHQWIWRSGHDLVLEESPPEAWLEGDELFLETETEEAMDLALAVLEPALEGLVGEAFVSCEEMHLSADSAEALRRIKDEGHRLMLDAPLPQFDDRTPREHAQTAAGRKQVADWIRHIEEMEQNEARVFGTTPCDTSWMWRELGLEGERNALR